MAWITAGVEKSHGHIGAAQREGEGEAGESAANDLDRAGQIHVRRNATRR
jgi:hypothetical protein